MKVGTVPKITVGAAALIALIIIGSIVIRQMNAPIVEERVYLSPWEDGTARPRNNLEGSQLTPLKIQKAGTICHKLLRQRPQQEQSQYSVNSTKKI